MVIQNNFVLNVFVDVGDLIKLILVVDSVLGHLIDLIIVLSFDDLALVLLGLAC